MLLPWQAQAVDLRALSVTLRPDAEHITLSLSDPLAPRVFHVAEPPPRIVVDLPHARMMQKIQLPSAYKGRLIKSVRAGYHDATTVRLVFDLARDVAIEHVAVVGSKATGYRLEFDLRASAAAPPRVSAAPIAAPTFSPLDAREGLTLHQSQLAPRPTLVPPPVAAPSEPPAAAVKESGFAVPADEKPIIVIDAGHGGQDPGTAGHAGTREKDMTLRYARAVAAALDASGHYHAYLTRSDDRYLFLRDRVARARHAHGNLFISLHADSAPTREARGLSVYTISETASDKESALLAAKENKADVIGGMDLSATSADVADILIDLARRETREKSARFAEIAVKSLGKEVSLLSNTHRFAGFAVLKAPDIPSVLIEIGFLTNPREEMMIRSEAYQEKVVHALVRAIDQYYHRTQLSRPHRH